MEAVADDVKPTRVSSRIQQRRHQKEQPELQAIIAPLTAYKPPQGAPARPSVPNKSSPSKKKRKAESTPEKSVKSPPRPSIPKASPKKVPPAPCRQPPYPLYHPGETPNFAQGMESVVKILRSCKNIAVLTGAGISVSCGIPDFRSKGVGLYSVLDCEALGLSCPEELFDWEFFQGNPYPFFQFAKKLYFPLEHNQKVRPSDSHKLLRLLQDRKQLLRVYSQNIDGLEEEAGVISKKIVYAHGSLKWATCLTCKRKVPCDELEESILEGAIPFCQAPSRKALASSTCGGSNNKAASPPRPIIRREPSARQRNRQLAGQSPLHRQSSSSSTEAGTCGGVLKPNVTFFGQVLPDNVSRCLESDRKKVDALIVIGTSLSVAPISKVIGYLPPNIPRILINRTIVHPRPHNSTGTGDNNTENETEQPDFRTDYVFDAYLLGNCDDVTRALVKHLRVGDRESGSDNEESTRSLDELEEMGRLLSEVRNGKNVVDKDNETLYRSQDWLSTTVPAERVFLFPGAQPSMPFSEETVVQLQEVCHCNACSKRIQNGHIHKCLQCFDFDLCASCFPAVSKEHYEGQHQFGIEEVKPVQVEINR